MWAEFHLVGLQECVRVLGDPAASIRNLAFDLGATEFLGSCRRVMVPSWVFTVTVKTVV